MITISDKGFIVFFRSKLLNKPPHARSYFEKMFLDNSISSQSVNISIARGSGKTTFINTLWEALLEYGNEDSVKQEVINILNKKVFR